MVNDGSSDETGQVLARLATGRDSIEVLEQPINKGKAEAVRHGLLSALQQGVPLVGYLDADLSTPVEEILRLRTQLRERNAQVVLGARVKMLGRHIERRAPRHYLGRVFATAASLILGLGVYDTQCGAKLFCNNAALKAALEHPFISRWAFDVELIGRLLRGTSAADRLEPKDFIEVPLERWVDVSGSKLGPISMVKAGFDLFRIALVLRERRP